MRMNKKGYSKLLRKTEPRFDGDTSTVQAPSHTGTGRIPHICTETRLPLPHQAASCTLDVAPHPPARTTSRTTTQPVTFTS